MKLKFKGFSVIPLLAVMFLLVISAVTSYVAINRGNVGYVSRATTTSSCFVGAGKTCNQRAVATLSCPDGTIFCSTGLKCYDTNGIVVTGTKTGKCALNPGQGNGSCSATFAGATCKSTSSCAGTPRSGYCPGDATWKCCVPSSGGDTGGTDGGTGGGTDSPPAAEPPTSETPQDGPTTVPPTVPPTETPVTTGDATIALTLKLQGVTGSPKGSNTVPFKVKLKNETSTTDYATGTLTADSSGKWTGSANFSGIAVGPDTGYSVYVKVGKHFQKRICVKSPNESPVGTYSCSDNTIPLTSGENNLDFTGILQLVGDLPSASGEQNGEVDSYDKGFVLNHQRSTNSSDLQIGDLNFDGAIDTNDWSLILQSLSVKYDDE